MLPNLFTRREVVGMLVHNWRTRRSALPAIFTTRQLVGMLIHPW